MLSLDKVVKQVKKELELKTLTTGTAFEDPSEYCSTGNLALDWCYRQPSPRLVLRWRGIRF
jgi:hypothetical protein